MLIFPLLVSGCGLASKVENNDPIKSIPESRVTISDIRFKNPVVITKNAGFINIPASFNYSDQEEVDFDFFYILFNHGSYGSAGRRIDKINHVVYFRIPVQWGRTNPIPTQTQFKVYFLTEQGTTQNIPSAKMEYIEILDMTH